MELLKERFDWGKYISPMSDRNIPPFNWYGFKHRFGSNLVSEFFSEMKLQKDASVFDPFSGGGTTLIKSKMEGYDSFGLDISPFSVFISEALATKYNFSRLEKGLNKIDHRIISEVEIPDVNLLKKSFSDKTLNYIFSLKESIDTLAVNERKFFLLVLLSIIDKNSKAKKSGGFLRITNNNKVSSSIFKKSFIESSKCFMENLKDINYCDNDAKAFLGDARKYPNSLKERKFDVILTSPPYPNRHDYTRIYQLELLIGFIDDNDELKKLRYKTLRSHVEARKVYSSNGYIMPEILKQAIDKLQNKQMNNSKILSTLEGYFEDMFLVIKEMRSVLKENGHIGLVVSNVQFAGIGIPVDLILGQIGEQVGLKTKNIYILRYRGNSAQQMAKFERNPTRESLIIWGK